MFRRLFRNISTLDDRIEEIHASISELQDDMKERRARLQAELDEVYSAEDKLNMLLGA